MILAAMVTVPTSAVADAAQPAALRIVCARPLTLQGTGFYARERVLVTVHMGSGRWTERTRAGSHGTFTAGFGSLRLRYCSVPLTITARGARGDVARAPLPPRECAPSAAMVELVAGAGHVEPAGRLPNP